MVSGCLASGQGARVDYSESECPSLPDTTVVCGEASANDRSFYIGADSRELGPGTDNGYIEFVLVNQSDRDINFRDDSYAILKKSDGAWGFFYAHPYDLRAHPLSPGEKFVWGISSNAESRDGVDVHFSPDIAESGEYSFYTEILVDRDEIGCAAPFRYSK